MATIRKRGDRQWEARIRRKGHPTTCKAFDIKTEARAWARDVESEMDKGVFVSRKAAETTTLKERLQSYLDNKVPTLAAPKREENCVIQVPLQSFALALQMAGNPR